MRISPRQSLKLLRSQKAGVLIGVLMLIIGLGAFVHAGKVTWDERSARDWIPHLAQVENAGLITHEKDDGSKSYSLDVTYRYDWNGTPFKGTQYLLHDKPSPSPDGRQKLVKDLLMTKQDGGQYPIFVNPKKPAQSAILNSVHPKARSSSLFLGFLFSILGYFAGFNGKLFKKRSPD